MSIIFNPTDAFLVTSPGPMNVRLRVMMEDREFSQGITSFFEPVNTPTPTPKDAGTGHHGQQGVNGGAVKR